MRALLPEKLEQPGGKITLHLTDDGRTWVQMQRGIKTIIIDPVITNDIKVPVRNVHISK